MNYFLNWLDDRTGYRGLMRDALSSPVPGGSRWRYAWGSALTFLFFVQIVTGLFLWMSYSPSVNDAWESVYYIQHEVSGGWLVRGIHYYASQAMIVLLILHVLRVILDGAYRPPREFNLWMGMVLLGLVLGMSLTGYLLPWDQNGYWATKVRASYVAAIPHIGPALQRLIAGAGNLGHLTLTRFFALHAGVLPALAAVFVAVHIRLFQRHGVTPKPGVHGSAERFWPDQCLRAVTIWAGVLAAVVGVVLVRRAVDPGGGAPLGAPADPSVPYDAARPEWFFLFLFQFVKLEYFAGEKEVWGVIYIPAMIVGLFFIMPLIGRWKIGHRFNVLVVGLLLLAAAGLSGEALWRDYHDQAYHVAVRRAEMISNRAVELAQSPVGIGPRGAAAMLREDPFTQGPKLFAAHCASCHRYEGHDGLGHTPQDPPSASDLKGFASRRWIEGLLDPQRISTPAYYGGTAFAEGDMVDTVNDFDLQDPDEVAEIKLIVKALSAEAKLPAQKDIEQAEAKQIQQGLELIGEDGFDCTQCHVFHGQGRGKGPELTGYGSRPWLMDFIANPAHKRFYAKKNDRMPAYLKDEVLTTEQIGIVADWLRGDWYRPGESGQRRVSLKAGAAGDASWVKR